MASPAQRLLVLHFNDVRARSCPVGFYWSHCLLSWRWCVAVPRAVTRAWRQVYNINERELEPVGGVSRFATLARSFAEHNPMMVFSGDALSPSNSACPRP